MIAVNRASYLMRNPMISPFSAIILGKLSFTLLLEIPRIPCLITVLQNITLSFMQRRTCRVGENRELQPVGQKQPLWVNPETHRGTSCGNVPFRNGRIQGL